LSASHPAKSASISQFTEIASSPQAAIAAAFPQFRNERAVPLDEGWDFQLYEIESGWLLRLPKHSDSVPKLETECRLLPDLADWLSLPIPRYRCANQTPYPLMAAYRKLTGIPADLAENLDQRAITRQLGQFLTELHSYPVHRARSAGVREIGDTALEWGARALEQLESILLSPARRHDLGRFLRNRQPPPFDGEGRLIHNDLWAEHILIDPDSGRVGAIIDWGDVTIGEPAVDFAFLLCWCGESWLVDILDDYDTAAATITMPQVRYLATCLAIRNINLGRELDRPAWVLAGETALNLIHR
jgi:aminoglycoside phosphotransferase (APT) family kinase protein